MADAPQDWKQSLPDDLKAHESLKDVKDVASLAKVYVDTKAHVGNSLRLPGPEASAEDRVAFVARLQEKFPDSVYLPKSPEEAAALEKQIWGKLGRPEDAKGYDFKDVDTAGAQVDFEALAKMAHQLGMTRNQAKEFARGVVKNQGEQAAALKASQDALKKEWGQAYPEKLAAAADVAAKLHAPAKVVEAIKAGRLSVDEAKFYDSLATSVGGTGRQVADQSGGAGKLTPDEAKLRLSELGRNPAFWNGSGPEHEALVARQRELMAQAYPELVGKQA